MDPDSLIQQDAPTHSVIHLVSQRRTPMFTAWRPRSSPISSVDDAYEIKWTRALVSVLTFNVSETYYKQLDTLVSTQVAFRNDWSLFMAYCIMDWRQCIAASILLIIATLYIVFPVFPVLACASTSLACLSIIISTTLLHMSHMAHVNTAPAFTFRHLESIASPTFRFQKTAFIFALPKATFIYALLIFFSRWTILLY